MIICKMFDLYGIEGLLDHFKTVRDFYDTKKTQMIAAVERHLQGNCVVFFLNNHFMANT